jgi:lincosamide nucleotidyltransferase A/C/D/E
MNAADVIQFCSDCEARGIAFWIDGGWAVDAVLGWQTRPHADLDIAIEEKHVPALRTLLAAHGWRDVPRDDTHRWNFVLGDEAGREIDVHAFVFDANGNVAEGIRYPAESLRGTGVIAGHPVACITPEYLVRFRTGYPIREKDRMDVDALCARFGIERPAEYRPGGAAHKA